jgi:tetratricopeptide (TPR) repeat protein
MKTLRLVRVCAILLVLALVSSQNIRAQQPNYGDGKSSTLLTKAWQALGAGDYKNAIAYTTRCINTNKTQAIVQQKKLQSPAGADADRKTLSALNDVGGCYYVRGKAEEALGNTKDALADYKYLVETLPDAQCHDMKGWDWKPAKPAAERIAALEGGTGATPKQ